MTIYIKKRKKINIQIGRRIQKTKEASKYTQKKLSEKVGVFIEKGINLIIEAFQLQDKY